MVKQNKNSPMYQYKHRENKNTKSQQIRTGRVNKPANRDNQQKPQPTTDLAK